MTNPSKQIIKSTDKEALLAMVSHDLKNPVNSGIMALKLLQDSKLSPLNSYQKEILNSVMAALIYMKSLIENILDRYKFNNKVYKVNKVSVDFIYLVSSVIEESKYIFEEKNQTVKLIINLTNGKIDIDALEIRRVINNLLSNSSQFSPEMSEIIIKIFENNKKIYLSIENPGHGINLDDPNKVFDKFVTSDNSNKYTTSGLGLYIAKEIINAHNGEIFAESEVDKFTRFTLNLPRK